MPNGQERIRAIVYRPVPRTVPSGPEYRPSPGGCPGRGPAVSGQCLGGGGPDMTGVTPRQMVETTSTVISVGVGIATGNFKPLLVLVGTEVLIAIMENNEKNRQQN